MTQEDKELLLRDLCARLPYGVKCKVSYNSGVIKDATLYSMDKDGFLMFDEIGGDHREFLCKPYLFPLSSMTEEQNKIYHELIGGMFGTNVLINYEVLTDFFNKNHLDYRGLIKKGMANDATGLNIYKED